MKCYRCSHSGKLLPPDYKANWGIFYGHGLGTEPVSECLDSNMRSKVNLTRANYTCSPQEFMFPFHITHAKIELVDVPEKEYNNPDNRLILAIDDPDFRRRAEILRKNQKGKREWQEIEIAAKGQPTTERKAWR
jgi:hypothetical protein